MPARDSRSPSMRRARAPDRSRKSISSSGQRNDQGRREGRSFAHRRMSGGDVRRSRSRARMDLRRRGDEDRDAMAAMGYRGIAPPSLMVPADGLSTLPKSLSRARVPSPARANKKDWGTRLREMGEEELLELAGDHVKADANCSSHCGNTEALDVFKKHFKYEVGVGSAYEKACADPSLIKSWFLEQSVLNFQPGVAVDQLAERCADLGIFSLANLVALDEGEVVPLFTDVSAGGSQKHTLLARPGHTARLMLIEAHRLALKLHWEFKHGSSTEDAQPSSSNQGTSDMDALISVVKPVLLEVAAQGKGHEATGRKMAKALDRLSSLHANGKKKQGGPMSDSEDEEGDKDRVNLGDFLRKDPGYPGGIGGFLKAHWFTEAQSIGRADRKASARVDKSVPYPLKASLAEWTPPWVTQGKRGADQTTLSKNRSARIQSNMAAALGNIACEMLTYYAIGEIPLVAVTMKLLLSIQLMDEHGLEYALAYHQTEKDLIAGRAKVHESLDVGKFISKRQVAITDLLKASFGSSAFEDVLQGSRGGKAQVKGSGRLTASPVNTPPAAPQGVAKHILKSICFNEDARIGKSCQRKASGICDRQHVNTNNKSEAEKFDAAKAAFDKKREKKQPAINRVKAA